MAASASALLLGDGRALSRAEFAFMEPHFGADFGSVRVHDDALAQRVLDGLDARGMAHGENIALARGAGPALLAYELAHVLQQRQGGARPQFEGKGKKQAAAAAPGVDPKFREWWKLVVGFEGISQRCGLTRRSSGLAFGKPLTSNVRRRNTTMRVVVVGTSGCGKTAFAQSLAQRIAAEHIELDTLHWAENWTTRPREQFVEAVRLAAASERWVADGNYSAIREVLWPRATHVAWLNFSRTVVLSRIFWRTLRRVITREPLWHGNRESFANAFLSSESVLLWSLSTYSKNVRKYTQLRNEGAFPHLHWHVFSKPSEAERFLATYAPAAA